MPSVKFTGEQLKQAAQALLTQTKESTGNVARKVVTPPKLQEKVDGATRVGQVLSLLFLGPIILVNLILIKVVNNILADILGGGGFGDGLSVVAFLVTFLTLALLIMSAWGWFQFVRTAGFGAFA